MTRPVRLQLSRRKGFDLQAISRAYNGRDAVNVARPGKWGNPFLVHPDQRPGRRAGAALYVSVPTVEDAIACFREMMACEATEPDARSAVLRAGLPELRGKNLACWCKAGEPCHGDVLLELANKET